MFKYRLHRRIHRHRRDDDYYYASFFFLEEIESKIFQKRNFDSIGMQR